MEKQKLKPNQIAMLGAILVIVIAWLVPGLHYFMLPLQYLNTHLHEIGHAVVAAGTGADVHRIMVFSDGSGVTQFSGGIYFLTAAAGYIGATAFGALMIALSHDEKGAKISLAMLGGLLTLSLLLWTRGDAVGLATGVFFAVACIVGAKFAKGTFVIGTAQFIGIYQCLTALQSVFGILNIGGFQLRENDAILLQEHTGIPALLSALVWTGISVAIVYGTLRFAWSGRNSRLGI